MLICSLAYLNGQASIDPSVIQSTISTLTSRDNSNKQSIEKGVSQVARLWLETDGDEKAFRSFCEDNYIADPENRPDRQRLFHPPPGTHRAYDGET